MRYFEMALKIDPEQENRIRETVARAGSESAEDFVRAAVEQALLEAMLMDGLKSGAPIEGTREYWVEKRNRVIRRSEPK
jgi:hypothetical protein